MSNLLETIQFLKDNPGNFIRLTNMAGEIEQPLGKKDIYLSDIPNEDLAAYIKFLLGSITTDAHVIVERRRQKGATHEKAGPAFKVIVKAPEPIQATPVVEQTVSQNAQPVQHNPQVMPAVPGMGMPFGLSAADAFAMMRKADKLDDVISDKEELKEIVKGLRAENRTLEIDKRELQTKLSIAEAQKDMAVLAAKMENKSFFDSQAFQNLMEKAPDMVGMVMEARKGSVPQVAASGLGAANISETKKTFVEYIIENCSDDQVNYLGSIIAYMSNPNFVNKLNALISNPNE
ncbi:hypothetical protein [Flavobacterium suncheonense]|uniref:Uncharacterized protein n=1 Tax=Flavobacterium suncheonense GH29-5 = DSM 17707 TaxID=1121899 RepID=A0A0A2MBA7_9FLAO|nr:hypothetical protein [Flavobacterium suncheonense]KGO89549.1 hypothetical protein Q764_07200 [Flavobacterium suncheonense GH29-5 = DSM 17707]